MSYDLEVLVTERKILFPVTIDGIRVSVSAYKARRRYIGTFDYMRKEKGIWRSLFDTNKENRYLSAYNICDIKDIDNSNINYPFWEDRRNGMYVFSVRDEYIKSFENVLLYLINKSPRKQIMFLPRLQGGEYNNVCGVITLEKFFELLSNNKILFNIVYIIQR